MSLKNRYKKSWPIGLPFSLDLNNGTLFNNLKFSAKTNPNQDAIIFYGNKITYSNLFLDVKRIAGFLKRELNLSKGDRVIIDGRLRSREWTDKNGSNRTSYSVLPSSFSKVVKPTSMVDA